MTHDEPQEIAAPFAPGALRILMISPAGVGGTTQYAHNLCNALAGLGHRVSLATALDCEMAAFERHYELLGVFDRFKPRFGPLRAFFRHVRELDPDIIHLQGAQRPEFYWLLLKVLRRLTKARFVWTPQDVVSNSKRGYHTRLLRATYAQMSHVFLNARQNETALRELYGVESDKITVLPIPDLVAFARTGLGRAIPPEIAEHDSSTPMVLCFGLIEPRKGIAELIEAFHKVSSRTNARLVIMGKPLTDLAPFEHVLQARPDLVQRVSLIPRYADFEEMNALFEASTLVVLPYVAGWNSGVLASAYGFGKPVIATRVGGFDEVVEDGVTGLLVEPGDIDALGEAMLSALENENLRARLAAGAKAAGQASSWDKVAQQTQIVYNLETIRVNGE
ncbi:glycosyltransferase family 4 protein [Primorskyibacter sp. S187A]|uniref:glycosyltransferase family 4 protein n=1 Tax=Primorskyibacter sp. S187A TaxID=3415130 RepID=UPI003C7C26D5